MPVSLPAGLSKPLVDFAAQEADMGETCEFEAGEDRRAPISTTVPSSVEVRWHMTQDQFDLFDAWFEDDLFAGSLSFYLPTQGQGVTQVVILEAMFLEPPECTCVHKDNWEVSAKCVTSVAINEGMEGADVGGSWTLADPAIPDITAPTEAEVCVLYAAALTLASGGESTWTNLGPTNGNCYAVASPSGTIRAAEVNPV